MGSTSPCPEQYGTFLWDLVQFDLGESFRSKRSVWSELGRAVPYSIELGVLIVLVGFTIAVPVGIISAVKQDQLPDYLLRGGAIFALAAPVFWTASIAVILVLQWDLFKIDVDGQPHSLGGPEIGPPVVSDPHVRRRDRGAPRPTMRLLRSQMLEVLREDYVVTARAKGLPERTIIMRHVLRNAWLPVLTVMGLTVATIIGSQIVLEQMFNVPGVGRLLFQALTLRDTPLLEGLVLVVAFVVVFTNLFVDLLYGLLDPRVRLA